MKHEHRINVSKDHNTLRRKVYHYVTLCNQLPSSNWCIDINMLFFQYMRSIGLTTSYTLYESSYIYKNFRHIISPSNLRLYVCIYIKSWWAMLSWTLTHWENSQIHMLSGMLVIFTIIPNKMVGTRFSYMFFLHVWTMTRCFFLSSKLCFPWMIHSSTCFTLLSIFELWLVAFIPLLSYALRECIHPSTSLIAYTIWLCKK